MKINKTFSKIALVRVVLLFGMLQLSRGAAAQLSISGPQCIIPGRSGQYIVSGNWGPDSWMKLCVRGGRLENGQQCYVSGAMMNTFFITWVDTSSYRLELSSSLGNITLELKSTTELGGGAMNEDDRIKICDSAVTDYTFRCASATGGSCNPVYTYQWQRSENGLNWTNIAGANMQDLIFNGTVLVNTYFRRVTTESGSNTIAYSDQALLAVNF